MRETSRRRLLSQEEQQITTMLLSSSFIEPHTQEHPVQRKSFRAAALCLGVMCLLMMAGIIILSVRRKIKRIRVIHLMYFYENLVQLFYVYEAH